ncbi:hypothetical protein RESH_03929 [Rhodopirellula europaea SH398]|uniref:Uncharacterized protein n=1 Tax=Rhodopirellula europaea SH398 TaxID=1263868 RepID=M5SGW2_9BACT|nr:hypothetical protein RESH_03929 [Rhodopirellula europaea SH398]
MAAKNTRGGEETAIGDAISIHRFGWKTIDRSWASSDN